MKTETSHQNPAINSGTPANTPNERVTRLVQAVLRRAPMDAANILSVEDHATIGDVASKLPRNFATQILLRLPPELRDATTPEITQQLGTQLILNQRYAEDSVGRLMEAPQAVFGMGVTVRQAVERIREISQEAHFTYAYVTDDEKRLQGVVVMRELLLAHDDDLLISIMLENPFYFHPETEVSEAMRAVVHRHYPVYPVCDHGRRLLGLVQGYMLFEQQAFEISSQAGRMVGVGREEHLATHWLTCLKYRHPWLQLNLLTAFVAAGVVSQFEDTISQIVVLAAFLPVLAGQSGNTGCQALAVTLRGLTLEEFQPGSVRRVVAKEALLGLMNGMIVGCVAAMGMYFYAVKSQAAQPLMLSLVVVLAMTVACITSGVTGVLVPVTLKRLGADPATASSIFLTTATDVASMGMFLWLAQTLVR